MSAPLDPNVAEVMKALPLLDGALGEAEDMRALLRSLSEGGKDAAPLAIPHVWDERIAGASGPLPARVYRSSTQESPTIVYFHGGGWVAGDLDSHDHLARVIALETNAVVVSVAYRLAPETPFPGPFDDAVAAVRDVVSRIDRFGGDRRRIGVAGDSAGANLAAAAALACRDEGMDLAAQLLVNPAADLVGLYSDARENARYPSRREVAEGHFLTLRSMQWFSRLYFADPGLAIDWRASPLRAKSLANVAPAVVAVSCFDPLRDEGEAYARALEAAGVNTRVHHGAGMIHGYFLMGAVSPAAQAEIKRVCADFKAMLSRKA